MKIERLDYVPDFCLAKKWKRYKLIDTIESFWNSSDLTLKLTWEPNDAWKNAISMRNSFNTSLKRLGYAIRIHQDGNDIYLFKLEQ